MLAAIAAVLSGLAAAAPREAPSVTVVRARTQLPGGVVVSVDDVETGRMAESDAPQGALGSRGVVVGQTLAAPVAQGQVLTGLALVGARAALAAGHVVAPLRIADQDLASLLHSGDVVDVLAADSQSTKTSVIAESARVISVPQLPGSSAKTDPGALVLLDVAASNAPALARAAASGTVTVVWP